MFGIKFLLIGLLSMYSLAVCSADKLTLITYSEVPFAAQAGNTKQGLVIEFIDALFKQAGLEYEILFFPLKRGMSMAESSVNTCVLPIERNQHREVHYTWIGPVMVSRYGIFSASPSQPPLVSLNDAKFASIGSFLGSGIGEYLTQFGYQVDLTNNDTLNVKKLQRGRIDFWAADLVSAKAIMRDNDIHFGEPKIVFFTSIRAMACHIDLPMATQKRLNDALQALYKSGYMAQLHQKYGLSL
ncbi:substrate-binding periplasmic protein [Shewanella holmiensis]|uniref:ABC transporter substrate-binding protein n=1 Tax=Shewanella holmiensis TaxID=2952222 RepID=A0A9X3ANT6_9GAMM|nr:ABC transporter substrate-binding protein [Shewanella holmiensis]